MKFNTMKILYSLTVLTVLIAMSFPANSNNIQVEKEKTCMETMTIKEPYTCEVDICVPIEKTRRVKEYFTKTEMKTVKNPYTTLEPRKRTKMVTAYVPETVYEEKTKICKVKVPYTVEEEVPVKVTRMVPKKCSCCCKD